jgi:hypothetical protein
VQLDVKPKQKGALKGRMKKPDARLEDDLNDGSCSKVASDMERCKLKDSDPVQQKAMFKKTLGVTKNRSKVAPLAATDGSSEKDPVDTSSVKSNAIDLEQPVLAVTKSCAVVIEKLKPVFQINRKKPTRTNPSTAARDDNSTP